MTNYINRIVTTTGVLGGKPRISNTRISVKQILDSLAQGISSHDLISDDYYPELNLEDIYACLQYASTRLDHLRVIRDVSTKVAV